MALASAGHAQSAASYCRAGTMQGNESGAIWIRVSSRRYFMPEFREWNARNMEFTRFLYPGLSHGLASHCSWSAGS
jgi:hypothetical protein